MEFNRNRFKVEGKSSTVTDRVSKRIATHITRLVLLCTKCTEGVLIQFVDRSTSQTKEESIRQCGSHFLAKVSFLSSVCFVNHQDNVMSFIQASVHLAKLEDGGNQDFSHIALKEVNEFFLTGCLCQTRNIRSIEGRSDLSFQINTVIHDNNGWIFQFRYHSQLLCSEHHQKGFTRTLEVPDKTLFRITCTNTVYNRIRTFKLLITANDFIFTVFLVCCKQCEESEDIHYDFRFNHILHTGLNISKSSFATVVIGMPRTPDGQRSIDGTVTIALALGCEVEHIGHEHLRNTLFIGKDIASTVHPRNCISDRGFQFTNRNRETVDKKNDIKSLATFCLRVYPLIGNNIFVLCDFFCG